MVDLATRTSAEQFQAVRVWVEWTAACEPSVTVRENRRGWAGCVDGCPRTHPSLEKSLLERFGVLLRVELAGGGPELKPSRSQQSSHRPMAASAMSGDFSVWIIISRLLSMRIRTCVSTFSVFFRMHISWMASPQSPLIWPVRIASFGSYQSSATLL